jgi:hypothetical protein
MRAFLILSLVLSVGCFVKADDTGEPDGDNDGYPLSEDCDDTNPDVNPGAIERCNGVDDDCDGEIDEEGAEGSDLFYADLDGDGFGDETNTIEICDMPEGYVASAYDCDDSRADVNPTGTELCDEADNDCDGEIDEDADDAPTWYADADGDGYGDEDSSVEACDQPSDHVDNADDCDDDDDGRSPMAVEVCDGSDNNCDGHIDEDSAVDAATWYGDNDGDGYGSAAATTAACQQPSGYVGNTDDCDDRDDAINPDADEICDGVDNDCDGGTDEDGAIDAATWYADADADGYGDPGSATLACDEPSGHVDNGDDCDDADATINPDAEEICDGLDNDCDGAADATGLVTLNGTANYGTISEALRAARSGGTVVVCDGTYSDYLEIITDLTLRSQNGSGATTIDASGSGPCITVTTGSSTITGFTLTDGQGAEHPVNPEVTTGGGIQLLTNDAVVLEDLVFLANEADFGGGLFGTDGCTLSISDSTFELNDAEYSGGGAYLWDCTVTMDGVTFEDNYGTYGGAVFLQGSTVELGATTALDNYASEYGGAFHLSEDAAVNASVDTLITGNTAADSGGGLMLDSGATWAGGTVDDNEADFGGGFFAYTDGSGDNEIEDLICSANQADTSGGCGYVFGDISITSSEILANGGQWGGGLMADDAVIYLMSSTIEENTAFYYGGGVYLINDAVLASMNSDWGSASADNDPDDVYVDSDSAAYTLYGTSETFTCSDTLGYCY